MRQPGSMPCSGCSRQRCYLWWAQAGGGLSPTDTGMTEAHALAAWIHLGWLYPSRDHHSIIEPTLGLIPPREPHNHTDHQGTSQSTRARACAHLYFAAAAAVAAAAPGPKHAPPPRLWPRLAPAAPVHAAAAHCCCCCVPRPAPESAGRRPACMCVKRGGLIVRVGSV